MTTFVLQVPYHQSFDTLVEHVTRAAESFLATAGTVEVLPFGLFARTSRKRDLDVARVVTLRVDAELSHDDQLDRARSLERVLKTMCASTTIPADKLRVLVQVDPASL